MSTNALDNIVAEADAAAQNMAPAEPSVPATTSGTSTALARPNLDSFVDGGGMDVEAFVRLNDSGFRFGDQMQGLLDEIVVKIDMAQVTPIHSFRSEVGGNTKFLKSYDGITEAKSGMSFQQAIAACERQPGAKNSGIYPTVEIPMELTEAVADPKKGSTVSFDAGTLVGYTPSVTGAKAFQSFCKKLRQINPDLLQSTVTARVKHAVRTNSNNNRWGVLEFELVD